MTREYDPAIITPNRFATIARVSPDITQRSQDDLLALAQRHFLREFGEDEPAPWFCPVTISSDQQDSHFTYMDVDTTLPFFSEEAGDDRGVSVLDSHNSGRQPFGRSITGELTEQDGMNLVASWFYTVPGIQTSTGMRTDDYIANIERGISKEISVGFNFRDDGMVECSICGLNMMSWDCPHWPGTRYMHPVDPDDPDGPQQESLAIGRIINGHLSEYSFVYKGSNRESQTLRVPEAKARAWTAAGMIGEKEAFTLERAYGIDLHPWLHPRVFTTTGNPRSTKETTPVTTKKPTDMEVTVTLQWDDTLKAAFAEVLPDGVPDDPTEAFQALASRIASLETEVAEAEAGATTFMEQRNEARAEVLRLTPLAADGESYRADLVDQAVKAGIRAMDPNDDTPFPEEDVRAMLEVASVKSIIAYRDSQARIGDRIVGDGRTSRDTINPYEKNPPARDDDDLPVNVYASGRRRR